MGQGWERQEGGGEQARDVQIILASALAERTLPGDANYISQTTPCTVRLDVTFDDLLALADDKLGSRAATLKAIAVSRQRLRSAIRGGPPLRAERLIRLALVTGIEPTVALRAGGRATFAELLEEAYRGRMGDVTARQRNLLSEFERLHDAMQLVVEHLVKDLVVAQPLSQSGGKAAKRTG